MGKIVGIRLKINGKVYDFDSGHFVLKKGDRVVVNTEQGQALGVVCMEPRAFDKESTAKKLKKVFRLATRKDLEKFEKKRESEKVIYSFCYEKIQERSLPMCLVSVDRLFDGSKVIVYFSTEGRVDFRGLVKDLVQEFRTRVEMRQIGVRHQAKMVGGLGTCGRKLCCASFLTNFEPVSIRMAKKQNLSLNPSKISGMCGRLMCCLAFEYEYYNNAVKDIPKIGNKVETAKGKGKIIRHNLLKDSLTILLDAGEEIEVACCDMIRAKALGNGQERSKKE